MSRTEPEVVKPPRRSAAARPRPAKKRRTQAERSDEMRQRVIEAAAEVLRRKGYAGLRTDEVSRVAGVSRGAQQYHFRTKDSLVLATAAYLLRDGLSRGRNRASAAVDGGDPIEAIIQDCMEFFLGRDFGVILDLVLASTKDRNLRQQVYQHTRESRLALELAWLDVLVAHGIPKEKAEKVLWITISIVRGFSVRALWQRDEKLFRSILDEWKAIIYAHLGSVMEKTR
jgi:AcrR family transcriptional regulator